MITYLVLAFRRIACQNTAKRRIDVEDNSTVPKPKVRSVSRSSLPLSDSRPGQKPYKREAQDKRKAQEAGIDSDEGEEEDSLQRRVWLESYTSFAFLYVLSFQVKGKKRRRKATSPCEEEDDEEQRQSRRKVIAYRVHRSDFHFYRLRAQSDLTRKTKRNNAHPGTR